MGQSPGFPPPIGADYIMNYETYYPTQQNQNQKLLLSSSDELVVTGVPSLFFFSEPMFHIISQSERRKEKDSIVVQDTRRGSLNRLVKLSIVGKRVCGGPTLRN
jgi:hypothetical protein